MTAPLRLRRWRGVVNFLVTEKRRNTKDMPGQGNMTVVFVEIKIVGTGQGVFLGFEVAPINLLNKIFYVELGRRKSQLL